LRSSTSLAKSLAKGIGGVGIVRVAVAAANTNAVYDATGKGIRSLPITFDKLMALGLSATSPMG
jgi:CO/xanthine dehydrogenase Mo-binding subunit